ncbi:MAG: hypothetical protein ABSA09_00425 [Desulfobaccales bacterium]|jgi:hypothetical protein
MVGLLALVVFLALAGGGLAQQKGFLWDGNQWPQLSYDTKVGYIKGVGNMADFEAESAKGKGNGAPIAQALASELKTKTVGQIIEQVDKFYSENPGKLSTSVLEVILIRCTNLCPPGLIK